MRITQYMRAERDVLAADGSGIRARWLFGLRLLADRELLADGGGLKHGVAAKLVAEAQSRGMTLSEQEIQRRLRCARAYPTEAQIRHAMTDFGTWFELINAKFPAYPAPDGEAPADYRTTEERRRDNARRLADAIGAQGALFPLDEFEPADSTLKDLHDYADEQDRMTANFVARGQRRREYLAALDAAAGGDLSVTWADAHRTAFGDGEPEDGDPSP
jgi:hypothetical protein